MESKFYVPTECVKAFNKFISKAQKNLKGLSVTIGESERQVFRHNCRNQYKEWELIKIIHDVCEVHLSYPDETDYELLARLEDVMLFPMNFGAKIDFPEGKDEHYHKCDICGRDTYRVLYILKHKINGEVLFMGKECAKKFGINTLNEINKFSKDLYSFIDMYGCGSCEDGEWYGSYKEDKRPEYMALSPRLVFAAAYDYYHNSSKEWIKGYYDRREYVPSKSASLIKEKIFKGENEQPNIDDDTYNTIIEWGKEHYAKAEVEFSIKIRDFCNNYYACANDACMAFFLIKNYYDSFKVKPNVKIGDNLKIEGVIKSKEWIEDNYSYYHSKMLLVKIKPKHYDITLIRFGSVKGDIGDTIVGYTSVKSIKKNGDIVLDRVRTRPKKGIDYKVLD